MKVFLNPGHAPGGNPDPGAVNQYNGLRECDVAANVCWLLEQYLNAAGVQVSNIVQDDSLQFIVDAANGSGADLFVSVHCNAAASTQANGTETWYYHASAKGKQLAECIQNQIVTALGTTDRGVKGAQPGVNGLYVLTNTDAVAVLVELAFISNTDDCLLLQQNQDDFARAIARGITDFQLIGMPG